MKRTDTLTALRTALFFFFLAALAGLVIALIMTAASYSGTSAVGGVSAPESVTVSAENDEDIVLISSATDDAQDTAEDTAADEENDSSKDVAKAIGASVAIAVAAGIGAISMALAICKTNECIARQPEAESKLRSNMMLGLIFIETAIIYALIVGILVVFVL